MPSLDLVVQGNGVTPHVEPAGQAIELAPRLRIHQRGGIEDNPRAQEIFPSCYRVQLLADSDPDLFRGNRPEGTPRSAPELVELFDDPANPMLIRVGSLAPDERLGEHVPCSRLQLARDLAFDRLELGVQVESEVTAPALDQEPLMFAGTFQHDLRRAQPGKP